jgi:RNA polymerase sigma-70 factor (ECF subfamily)
VIDGEDVLHEALIKAIEALPTVGVVANPEAWIFRIAHNTALDFLRHRARVAAVQSDEDITMVADPAVVEEERLAAAAGPEIVGDAVPRPLLWPDRRASPEECRCWS